MYVITTSGRPVSLLNPTPEQISLTDIAHALALTARWGGCTHTPLSVAQHSMIVADQLPPEWRAYGLLHDAHEAYLGDVTTPVKHALKSLGAGDALDRLATALDAAIYTKAGLTWPIPAEIAQAIKTADDRAKATEARDCLPPGSLKTLAAPLPYRLKAWAWPDAEAAYLQALAVHVPTMRSHSLVRAGDSSGYYAARRRQERRMKKIQEDEHVEKWGTS